MAHDKVEFVENLSLNKKVFQKLPCFIYLYISIMHENECRFCNENIILKNFYNFCD